MTTRSRPAFQPAALLIAGLILAVGGCGATPTPPRPDFPYLIDYPDNCPGEGCDYGEWLACDTVHLHDVPGGAAHPREVLLPNQPFEALTGVVVVEQPTVVVVTRPVQQVVARGDTVRFEPGDTVLVLDHSGEGFFHVWHERFVSSVDFFWPIDFGSRPEPYSAEVISEGSNSLWVATLRTTGDTAWVHATSPEVARLSSRAPSPVCRAG